MIGIWGRATTLVVAQGSGRVNRSLSVMALPTVTTVALSVMPVMPVPVGPVVHNRMPNNVVPHNVHSPNRVPNHGRVRMLDTCDDRVRRLGPGPY